ncbi:hypothetical protein ACLOJK_024152, partial [Asimina triloba]
SDDIERLTLHFLHFGPATPSRSRTTPATSPASRPFFSDPDEAAPTSTVRHQLPTAAGVQEPASAHIIQHLARQHERVRLHSMATHQAANSKSEAASASSLAIRTKKITRRQAAVLMALAKSSSLSSSVRQPLSDPKRTQHGPDDQPASIVVQRLILQLGSRPRQIVPISVPKSASKVQNMDTVGHHSDHQFSSGRKTESASIQTEIRQMRQRTHSIGHSSSKIIQPQTAPGFHPYK